MEFTGSQQARARDIRSFVDWAAHVDSHHAGDNHAHEDAGGRVHVLQGLDHPAVDSGNWRSDDEQADEAHDEDAEERIDEHRLDAFERLWQTLRDFLEEVDDVAAEETSDQGTEEAGACRAGESTADKTYGKARTVGNRHGDETSEDRQHEAERRTADILEEFSERCVGTEVLRVDGVIIEQEGEGDEDTAADDERQHVGNAVHQMFVNLAAEALALHVSSALFRVGARSVVDRSFACKGAVDELIGLVDAVGNFRDDDFLAVETGHGDVLVSSDDDAVGCGDFIICQDVLGTAGAVRLDLDGNAAFFRVLFKAFSGHERMGNARRAGRDGENLDVVARRSFLSSFCRSFSLWCFELAVFLEVDEVQEFFFGFCSNQGFFEVRVHNHHGQLLQDLDVCVVGSIRCGNHEEQAGRLAVHGLEVHALRHRHSSEAGFFDARALGMRRSDAVAKARRARSFAREDVF